MRTGLPCIKRWFENEAILAGKPSLRAAPLIRPVMLGSQRLRLARLAAYILAASALTLGVGVPIHADPIMINNGSAPPNPANVIGDGTYWDDSVYVRNVGCPPGWPAANPNDPCASPGDPTEALVEDTGPTSVVVFDTSTVTISGGHYPFGGLGAYDSSTAIVSGGALDGVSAYDASTVTISGGHHPFGGLSAYDSSTAIITGGSLNYLYTYDSSIVRVRGGSQADVYAYGNSTIHLINGRGWGAYANDSSTINVSSGILFDYLSSSGFATVAVSGGSIAGALGYQSGWLTASGNSSFTLSGGTVGFDNISHWAELSATDSAVFTVSGGTIVGNTFISARGSSLFKSSGTLSRSMEFRFPTETSPRKPESLPVCSCPVTA